MTAIERTGKKRQARELERHHHTGEGMWYWIFAIEDGKPALFGPCSTEDAALQEGYQKTKGNFEIVMMPTRNMAQAVRMMRMKRANKEDMSVFDSMARMRHKVND